MTTIDTALQSIAVATRYIYRILAHTLDLTLSLSVSLTKAHRSLAVAAALFSLSSPSFSGPILSEIHYNGIASGTDPDEFLELSNASDTSLELGGWRFTQGISYIFGAGTALAPATSLILARDPSEFRTVFSGFTGEVFDYSGALSNSGETLTLTNPDGMDVWSISYDDAGSWPAEADGLGSSLQLIFGVLDPSEPTNWVAQTPTPGSWGPSAQTPSAVPAPGNIILLATGLLLLGSRKTIESGRKTIKK